MSRAIAPSAITCSTCVARVARILPARYPPRPSGEVATQRSTPLRRSKPVRIAWEVKEVEISAVANVAATAVRSEEHTSELQSRGHLVCRLLLEKKNKQQTGGW